MNQTIELWSPMGIAMAAASVVLLALIAVAAASFATYAARRAKDSAVWSTISQLWSYAQAAVSHGEAELRPRIAKALEDGRLTPEEGRELKAAVIEVFKKMGGNALPDLQKKLGMDEGAFGFFISGMVERAVAILKPQPAVPIAAVPAASPATGLPFVPPRIEPITANP